MATDFGAIYSSITDGINTFYNKEDFRYVTLWASNPNPWPCDPWGIWNGQFKITEHLDPNSINEYAVSHEVEYLGRGNVFITGDTPGKAFVSDIGAPSWSAERGHSWDSLAGKHFIGPPRSIHDILKGGSGNDILSGLEGNDTLYGYGGNDILLGGNGNDVLYGGDGVDFLYGENGNDWLEGGNGDDYLNGGAGNDTLYGGAGDDWLIGGSGINSLYGGEGNDTYFFNSDTFYDEVWEYSGQGMDSVHIAFDISTIYFGKYEDDLAMADTSVDHMMVFKDWFLNFEVEEFYFALNDLTFSNYDVASLFGITPTFGEIAA